MCVSAIVCVGAKKDVSSIASSMCVSAIVYVGARKYVSSIASSMCVSAIVCVGARKDVSSIASSMCVSAIVCVGARKDVSSIASSMCVSAIERYWPHSTHPPTPYPPPKPPKMHFVLRCSTSPTPFTRVPRSTKSGQLTTETSKHWIFTVGMSQQCPCSTESNF